MDACHNIALLANDGRAMEGGADAKVAQQYYERACEGGFAPSCFNLSALLIQGSPGGDKNMPLALKYALRACELGHVWGCANASRMYKLGDGTNKDDQKAEELKNRARELHGQQKERQLKFGEWDIMPSCNKISLFPKLTYLTFLFWYHWCKLIINDYNKCGFWLEVGID